MQKDNQLTQAARDALVAELPALEQIVKRLLKSFNTERHECAGCGLTVMEHYADAQAAEVVRGFMSRIERLKRQAGVA